MQKNFFLLPALLSLILLSGCAQPIDSTSYDVQNVGSINKTIPGVIVSSRPVTVNQNTGVGTVAGGVGGGALGSAIGGGTRANIVGGVAGAVLGGVLGNAAEKGLSRQQAYEYIIRTNRGDELSVVQGPPVLFNGTHVLIITGARARIIVDQQYQH